MSWDKKDDNNNNDQWGSRKDREPDGPEDIDKAIAELISKIIALFGLGSFGSKGSGGTGRSYGLFTIASLLILIGLVVYGVAGLYTVDQQERGVILRFGALQPALQQPGLRWRPLIMDELQKVNVTRINNIRHQALMLTQDENIVNITMSVQYLINNPANYVVAVRDPRQSLTLAAESALRHMVGSLSMDDVLTEGRQRLGTDVQERIQRYMDNYKTGIRVVKVNIDDSQPPQQVAAAFDDVQAAQEDNQRVVNQANAYRESIIPQARGEARKQFEQATAYKGQVVARAEGEADRFRQLLVAFNKAEDVTRTRLYLDAMESIFTKTTKIVVDVKGGNNLLYLPLDQLTRGRQTTNLSSGPTMSAPDGASNSTGAPEINQEFIRRITDAVLDEASRRRNSSRQGNR